MHETAGLRAPERLLPNGGSQASRTPGTRRK